MIQRSIDAMNKAFKEGYLVKHYILKQKLIECLRTNGEYAYLLERLRDNNIIEDMYIGYPGYLADLQTILSLINRIIDLVHHDSIVNAYITSLETDLITEHCKVIHEIKHILIEYKDKKIIIEELNKLREGIIKTLRNIN